MKILFLFPLDKNNKSNLDRKFRSQVICASRVYEEVFYSVFDDGKIFIKKANDENYNSFIGKYIGKTHTFIKMHFLMLGIRKWLKVNTVDIVYLRKVTPTFSHMKALKDLYKTAKVCVEIPTFPVEGERKNSRRTIFYFIVSIFEKLFNGAYKKYVSLYSLIGEESKSYLGIPAVNIENGLDVSSVPVKKGFMEHPNEMHLLICAKISYWHGYDRVVNGLANYYKKYTNDDFRVYLHVCGDSADQSLNQLKQMVKNYGISRYVYFYGFLNGEKLNSLFDKCDVAIGSLGLFRQKLRFDTSLKLPEYTARGIPFIYANESRNVDFNGKYFLSVPADESPLCIKDVINFFRSIDKENVSSEMNIFALKNLQWDNQLRKINSALGLKEN